MNLFKKSINKQIEPAVQGPRTQHDIQVTSVMDFDEHELISRFNLTNVGSEQATTTDDASIADLPDQLDGTEPIAPGHDNDKDEGKTKKRKRGKRGTYEEYNVEQLKTALRLLYVDNFDCDEAAKQTKINYKTLNSFLNDRVKNHGYPKLPRKASKSKRRSAFADTDGDINKFFEEEIRPKLNRRFSTLSQIIPTIIMQPIFFYYEAGKFYYRETPSAMEEDLSEDSVTENEDASSSHIDEYVWTLHVCNGYTPARVGKFTKAIKNGNTNVYQTPKSTRIGKSMAYKLRDMIDADPNVVLGWKPRAEVPSIDLSIDQKFFISGFVEEHGPRIIWKEVSDALNKEYQERPVTNNAVKTYLLQSHAFSLGIIKCLMVSDVEY
ncbi:hypothetical protein BJV82DRAFT_676673 [Fennellomyces sp. T-0311]|nr:hypothetical protein BJV82DRAFT_676673 [Fennellomyces sp. T-0311]